MNQKNHHTRIDVNMSLFIFLTGIVSVVFWFVKTHA